MGSMNKIVCDNCYFSVCTRDNLTMMVCYDNSDYFDNLYCLDCQKVVRAWQRKNGEDMEEKCSKCGSRDVYLFLPDDINVKCPSCKKGNLRSEVYALID